MNRTVIGQNPTFFGELFAKRDKAGTNDSTN